MATEALLKSIPKPTTIRFPEHLCLAGKRVAAETRMSFPQLVRFAVAPFVSHENKNKPEYQHGEN